MKSLASLSLLLLAGVPLPALAQEPPAGEGPRGSSQLAAGETRYDAVGYAGRSDLAGTSIASAELSSGSYAEVTKLDTGKTIVVAVAAGEVARGMVAMLSPGAMTALGAGDGRLAVRVRKVTPTPQDVVQLRGGTAASFRAEAPASLLVALRKKLPVSIAATSQPKPVKPVKAPQPTKPVPVSAPKPPPAGPARVAKPTSGYVVQVAALSSAARAAVVARALGGTVVPGPPVWRVRLGPYPDMAAATRARADAARAGYAGGQITRTP